MKLLSGNEAIARGAYEAGVTVATGYPGTPSTEILENIVAYKEKIYCEWAPNEKVALEVAAAASFAGARAIVTMKHVGLNVAADPLMTLSYIGVEGGLLICVADDPGMHSSQNEQDSRNYASFAKIPLLEPVDSQQAKDFVKIGLEISEKYKTPVILRTTTRISHSRSIVKQDTPMQLHREINFKKDPERFVAVPFWARKMRKKLENKMQLLTEFAETSPLNSIEKGTSTLGIITSSISYQYVKEVWPDAWVLKLGMSFPFADKLIKAFSSKVQDILVVEELDDVLEKHIKSLGIKAKGKAYVPAIGELSLSKLKEVRCKIENKEIVVKAQYPEKKDLPARAPVLCPGCPHRGIFCVLGQKDIIVTGDIGCYSLGALKPLNRLDTILCMGGGVSMAHGLDKAGEKKKVVGIVGDSTFFHSGITGLLDIVYNKGKSTIIVVDNRITAMTGHQDNPGTGKTLMGENTVSVSIVEVAKACGVSRVKEVDPYDLETTEKVIEEELNAQEPSLIVSKAPCPLKSRNRIGNIRQIDMDRCKSCKKCFKIGCPAIELRDDKIFINNILCNGCGLCEDICSFGAIKEVKEDNA